MSFLMGLGSMMGTAFKTDYPATSPFALWRDDYDRRARQGEAKYYDLNRPSWMVEGARQAGVHPNVLFGGGASHGMRGSNTPLAQPGGGGYSQAFSGKGGGSAIQKRLGVLAIERAEIENAIARKQLNAPNGPTVTTDGVTVHPVGTKQGQPLHQRMLTEHPRESHPEKIEVIGPDGYRYTIVNPRSGDEISQIDYVAEKAKETGSRRLGGRSLKRFLEKELDKYFARKYGLRHGGEAGVRAAREAQPRRYRK